MTNKLAFALLLAAAAGAAGCNADVLGAGTPSDPATETFAPSLAISIASFTRTESGVYYRDTRVGTGDEAAAADQVTITYAGYLASSGTLFDSRSVPEQLSLAGVVPGFRDGVVGMRVGGARRIIIPSELGYGWQGRQQGAVRIPRNATLVFDVELFGVTKPATATQ